MLARKTIRYSIVNCRLSHLIKIRRWKKAQIKILVNGFGGPLTTLKLADFRFWPKIRTVNPFGKYKMTASWNQKFDKWSRWPCHRLKMSSSTIFLHCCENIHKMEEISHFDAVSVYSRTWTLVILLRGLLDCKACDYLQQCPKQISHGYIIDDAIHALLLNINLLYYYMRNFCNLIRLEQWYFSLIWNTYMGKLQTFCG